MAAQMLDHEQNEPLRKRRRSVLNNQDDAPPGMSTFQDLWEWPLTVVESLLKDDERSLRLLRHWSHGIALSSDYSGLDCPRECLLMGHAALEHLCSATAFSGVHADPVRVFRTCDKGQLQSRFQVQIAKTGKDVHNQHCHFRDLLERLPEPAQQYIAAASPCKGASRRDRAESYWGIGKWLLENREVGVLTSCRFMVLRS